jgi:hypothetical protein
MEGVFSTLRRRCEYCGRRLDPVRTVWLELNWKTGRWYADGRCPKDESQGGFPFGYACSLRVLGQQKGRE